MLDYWSDDCSGDDPDTFVHMDRNKTCTANFTCAPVIPGTYNGEVWVYGESAEDGTLITAWIGDVMWSADLTAGGRYALDIPMSLPEEPPCFEGGEILFFADDVLCDPLFVEWDSGLHDVDLDCY